VRYRGYGVIWGTAGDEEAKASGGENATENEPGGQMESFDFFSKFRTIRWIEKPNTCISFHLETTIFVGF